MWLVDPYADPSRGKPVRVLSENEVAFLVEALCFGLVVVGSDTKTIGMDQEDALLERLARSVGIFHGGAAEMTV